MKILKPVRMDRCIGCHSCALACARLVNKKFSWHLSGITIRTSGGLSTGYEASVCQACEPAACVAACPTKACTQRPGGGVKKNAELCIRCGKCAEACPVEAVHMDRETGYPYVCIHCGRCVPFCPHDCLEMGEVSRDVKEESHAS